MNFGMEVFNSIAQAAAIASPELPGDYRGEDGLCRCNGVLCFSCGQCAAICPVGAASLPGLEV